MLSIIIVLIVIAIDQLSKIACANALKLGESIEIIKGVFSIAYVENRGAAFGMLQNAQVFFIIATVIACGAMLYFMIKEYKRMHTAMRISLALIFAVSPEPAHALRASAFWRSIAASNPAASTVMLRDRKASCVKSNGKP